MTTFSTPGTRKQHVARRGREGLQLGEGIAVAGDRVEGDEGVAELVVEVGAVDAARQLAGDVADLLAHLVEGIGHVAAEGVALDLDGDDGAAGAREGAHEVEMRRLLELALDLVDHLVLHVGERGARPHHLHDHDAEGEVGVFLLADAHQAEHAGDDHDADQEAGDARVLDRPARKIERRIGLGVASHGRPPFEGMTMFSGRRWSPRMGSRVESAMRTFLSGVMNWVPADTTRSPAARPSEMRTPSGAKACVATVRGVTVWLRRIDDPDDRLAVALGEGGERHDDRAARRPGRRRRASRSCRAGRAHPPAG